MIKELNKLLKEIMILLIGFMIGLTAGYCVNVNLREELNEYKFNEYVMLKSQNDRGYENE